MQISLKQLFGVVFVCAILSWTLGRLFSEADTHAWYCFSYFFYDLLWLFKLQWLWTFDPQDIKEWTRYSYDETVVQSVMGFVGFMFSAIIHSALLIGCGVIVVWLFTPSYNRMRR